MKVLSVFDGISCGQVALKKAGVYVDKYFASEIDSFAMDVTNKNFPNTLQLGDITKVKGEQLPKIDLLIGGSPCQGLSAANITGKGLDDIRSALFYEYIRLLKELKPKYFLLENVLMDEFSLNEFSRLTGVSPIKIDSGDFSAQKRIRLYWTNIPIEKYVPLKILFKDILDTNAESFKLSENLSSRFRKTHSDDGSKLVIGTTALPNKIGQRDRVYGVNNKIPTLTATDYKQPKQVLVDNILRKLTPIECERLQTLPDNYTNILSNTQRYKTIGNGWTVDVIAHIFKGLKNE